MEALLAKEIARQRMGASAYGVLGPQGMALTPHTQPYSSSKAARAAANTQQQQAAAGPGSIPTAVNGKKPSALSQPVSFVSSGLQSDVRGDKAAIVIAPPLAAAAVAVNAAAAASVLQATVIGAAEIAEIIPTDGQEALKDCSCTQCFGAESAEKDQPMQEEQEPSCSGMISECEGALIDKDGHNDGDGTAPTGLSIEDDYDEEYDKDALDASSSGTDTDGSTDAEQDTGVDDGGTLHFGLGMANPQRAWLAEAFGGQLGGLGFSGPVVRGPLAGFQVRSAAPGDVLVESLAAASLASPRIAAAGGSHVADLPAEAGPSR